MEAVSSEFSLRVLSLGPDPALGFSYTSQATEDAALSNTALVLKPMPKIRVWNNRIMGVSCMLLTLPKCLSHRMSVAEGKRMGLVTWREN